MTVLAKRAEGNRPREKSMKLQPGLFPKSKQFGVAGAHPEWRAVLAGI